VNLNRHVRSSLECGAASYWQTRSGAVSPARHRPTRTTPRSRSPPTPTSDDTPTMAVTHTVGRREGTLRGSWSRAEFSSRLSIRRGCLIGTCSCHLRPGGCPLRRQASFTMRNQVPLALIRIEPRYLCAPSSRTAFRTWLRVVRPRITKSKALSASRAMAAEVGLTSIECMPISTRSPLSTRRRSSPRASASACKPILPRSATITGVLR
jgi:hypothetical protein